MDCNTITVYEDVSALAFHPFSGRMWIATYILPRAIRFAVSSVFGTDVDCNKGDVFKAALFKAFHPCGLQLRTVAHVETGLRFHPFSGRMWIATWDCDNKFLPVSDWQWIATFWLHEQLRVSGKHRT